jgi:hypothetical protein
MNIIIITSSKWHTPKGVRFSFFWSFSIFKSARYSLSEMRARKWAVCNVRYAFRGDCGRRQTWKQAYNFRQIVYEPICWHYILSTFVVQLTVLNTDILWIQANPLLWGLVLYQDRIHQVINRCGSASVAARIRHFEDLSILRTVNCTV